MSSAGPPAPGDEPGPAGAGPGPGGDEDASRPPPGPSSVGSLATEAALLVGVLRDWIGASFGPPRETGTAGTAGHPWPCAVCPVCRLLSGLATEHPEAVGHLMTAVGSLTAAVRSVRGADPADPADPSDPAGRRDHHDHPEAPGRAAPRNPGPGGAAGFQPPTVHRPRVQKIDIT